VSTSDTLDRFIRAPQPDTMLRASCRTAELTESLLNDLSRFLLLRRPLLSGELYRDAEDGGLEAEGDPLEDGEVGRAGEEAGEQLDGEERSRGLSSSTTSGGDGDGVSISP